LRASIGVSIGSDVQAHSAVLDATTASFLIADESKVDGIEALADVTDATNVSAAGGLLSGNNLSDVGTAATALSNIGGIGAATTNTLTNKTFDANGTGNVISNIDIGNAIAASQAEAEAGTDNTKLVTPLRVKQAIGALVASGGITLGTEQSTTSGTVKTFSSIPAGTKRITILFVGVSTGASNDIEVRLGDSGGIESTGYTSIGFLIFGSIPASTSSTTGFIIDAPSGGHDYHGHMVFCLEDSTANTWTCSHTAYGDTTQVHLGGGSKSLSAELTQLSLNTTAFDAGAVNINYE
jgi:hypothetical protein